ncbi:MAG: hypothetical protein WCF67_01005 [Chitinophagaceae bacterium]
MYYLCKFSDTWSVYDETTSNSRQLKPDEIQSLKTVFPSLFSNNNKILAAVKVEAINPNKLMQLSLPAKDAVQ